MTASVLEMSLTDRWPPDVCHEGSSGADEQRDTVGQTRPHPEPVPPLQDEGDPVPGKVFTRPPTVGDTLRRALGALGLDTGAVEALARSAEVLAAVDRGEPLGDALIDRAATSRDDSEAACPADARFAAGGLGEEADLGAQTRRASVVLDGIGALTDVGVRLDAALVEAARELTARHGRILLSRRGITDPGELSTTQRDSWRCRAKSVTRHEIEALTGWGAGETVDLVGLANAPRRVSATVVQGLRDGLAPWRLARRFWRECGRLDPEDAAHIAATLFGTDPATVAPERLTPDGDLSGHPWRHREFHTALDREVTKVNGRDPAAARAARLRALQARDVTATIDQGGTGCLMVRGSTVQVAAATDRIDRAARRARQLGDQRTLAQLRADLALSLLLHSGLDLPETPTDAEASDRVTVQHSAALASVLNAMPAATLEVIVPATVLHPPRPGRAPTDPHRTAGPAPGSGPGHRRRPGAGGPPGSADRPPDDDGEVLAAGQLKGAVPRFLTPDEVRDLALVPGSTMHRLLVDPATGRCLERSVTAYRPDALMRAQIMAADVTCRAPGCVRPAASAQLDHVREHATGGPTAETNLQALHTGHHDLKTHQLWHAVMGEQRDVTWTTLLGRIYRTRPHDYRQYVTVLAQVTAQVHAADPHDRQDAINDAVYAALCHRGAGEALQAEDDDMDVELRFPSWDLITLTHTTADGRRRYGPPPTTSRPAPGTRPTPAGQPEPDPAPSPAAEPESAGPSPGSPWGEPDDDPPPF